MSSWVESQPPSGIGCCSMAITRPSLSSRTLVIGRCSATHVEHVADVLVDRRPDVEAIVDAVREMERKGVPGLVRWSGRPYILA